MHTAMLLVATAWSAGAAPDEASGFAAGRVVGVSTRAAAATGVPDAPTTAPAPTESPAPAAPTTGSLTPASALGGPRQKVFYYGCFRDKIFGKPRTEDAAPPAAPPAAKSVIVPVKAEQPAAPDHAPEAARPAQGGFFKSLFRYEANSAEDRRWEGSRSICPD